MEVINEQSPDVKSQEEVQMERAKVDEAVNDIQSIKTLEETFARIPDQMAFKIGDVAEIADVKPYVLRYWEQEFSVLRPKKAVNNQRIYSRRDVETVLMIKKFLHIDKFSIPGAIRAIKLARKKQAQGKDVKATSVEATNDISGGLNKEELKAIEAQMDELISKIRSIKGKMIHKFFQIGL